MKNVSLILLILVWMVAGLAVVRVTGMAVRPVLDGLPSDAVVPMHADTEYAGSPGLRY